LTTSCELTARGYQKAFVCSDPDLIRFGVTKKVTDLMDKAGFAYEIYSEIKPNPTIENVQTGVKAFTASGADCIVAIGGGSSMDTAKAVGIIVNNPEFADVRSLEGVAPTKKHAVFTIAVPTTAGTAAEVTINYVITDVEKKRKFVCVDTNDIPEIAVVDPDMMSSMPKGLTASTGMDALTHAIEGYITKGAWEMTDMFHIKAIELIDICAPPWKAPRRAARAWRWRSTSPARASPTSDWVLSIPWPMRWAPFTIRLMVSPTLSCCRPSWPTTPPAPAKSIAISPKPWALKMSTTCRWSRRAKLPAAQ
jgi:alcohol dehydrogenase class IV